MDTFLFLLGAVMAAVGAVCWMLGDSADASVLLGVACFDLLLRQALNE